MARRPRLGILGGTFDPPHIGHLVTGIDVREALGLDEVLLVVANEPWQKVGARAVSDARVRLEMVAAAVGPEDGLVACDLELRRGGPSYTIDTLEELAARPDHPELFLVLGSDAAAGLDTWERAEGIDRLCTIVVVDRPGARTEVPPGFAVQHLEVPRLEVSSTDLRERVRTGRSLRHLVPDPVISLIRERGLYGGGDDPRPAGQVGSPGRAARP